MFALLAVNCKAALLFSCGSFWRLCFHVFA